MPQHGAGTKETIGVVGLGYVGLPLACLLAQKFSVSGYDANGEKIRQLKSGGDPTGEVGDVGSCGVRFSADPAILRQCTFIIVAVPTPVTVGNVPDFHHLEAASATVGRNLTRGAVVVYESTVHPGCTEEICLPILERESKLRVGDDFQLGYSPERVNPGDRDHAIDRVIKIVAGRDQPTLERVAAVYGAVTEVYRAPSIRVAEAAKVAENIQRDVNIALANELALFFDRIDLETREVLAAAGTKWNFHRYTPGLVGGHCIAVDPYYLVHQALRNGYEPKLILTAREINNYLPKFVVRKIVSLLHERGRGIGEAAVLLLGVAFKENVNDTRNSRAFELAQGFHRLKAKVYACDPLVPAERILEQGQGSIVAAVDPRNAAVRFDAIVVVTPHRQFAELTPTVLAAAAVPGAVLFDLKGWYRRAEAEAAGFTYHCL